MNERTDLDMAKMIADNIGDINSGDIKLMMTNLIEEVEMLRAFEQTSPAGTLASFYDGVHGANVKAGWWTDLATMQPKKRNVGEMFILIVTELAEAFGAYIQDAQDDKLPQHHGLGVEMADVQIRIADFMGALRAGRIVHHSFGTFNPGEDYFLRVKGFADGYEAIRKTPAAVGEPETGDFMDPIDPVVMLFDKLTYNANRADHKIENRLAEGGKRT